jgi:hypothetical protein
MQKNMIDPDTPQTAKRPMRFACYITKAADTHSEYATVTAFPQQQW